MGHLLAFPSWHWQGAVNLSQSLNFPSYPQNERYSTGYFVWPRYGDMIQGPKKVHPPISFARFMDVKSKGFGYTLSPSVEQFEHAQAHKVVLGMPHVTAAA